MAKLIKKDSTKGYSSHSQGGVDIKLGKNGFSFTRNNGVIEAKHGLVLPTKKHPLDPNPDGSLPSYFKGSKENPIELDEVIITAEAPEWVKYRKEFIKNNPFDIDKYVENRFNNPVGREAIEKIDQKGWRKKLKQEGLKKRYNSIMNYVGEQLVKNKPQGKLSRAEWLNQMTDKEEEIIKRNPKYQSSLWADTKRGLTSLVEQNPLLAFQNILNSSDYSNREKREMLKDYIDHPIMSKLGDITKILNPLTVPSKMVQSTYKDDYSFTDALKGKKNSAGIVEDIVTDPINLVGAGLLGKISKADKVIDATKAGKNLIKPEVGKSATSLIKKGYKKINAPKKQFKTDDVAKTLPKFKSEIDWSKWNKEIPNNKSLMDEYLQIEKTAKQNGTWMKNPDGSAFNGTPEQFVQQNSSNFKKAFGNSFDSSFRGTHYNYPDQGRFGYLFSGNKNVAMSTKYTTKKPTFWKTDDKIGSIAEKNKGGLYELYSKKLPINIDANKSYFTNIEYPEIAAHYKNNSGSDKLISTDNLADYIVKNNISGINVSNVIDESLGDIKIINTNLNPVKSKWYNNGMFDMTNPNIYKGIIPPASLLYLQSQNQSQNNTYVAPKLLPKATQK